MSLKFKFADLISKLFFLLRKLNILMLLFYESVFPNDSKFVLNELEF